MNWQAYFAIMLRAALLSTGGMGNLPVLRSDLIARGWAADGQFASALAIGMTAPGPNGLWVVSFGYINAGPRGAAIALAAILIPPLFILVLQPALLRIQSLPFVDGALRGLTLAGAGAFAGAIVSTFQHTRPAASGLFVCAAAFVLTARGKIPPGALALAAGTAAAFGLQ